VTDTSRKVITRSCRAQDGLDQESTARPGLPSDPAWIRAPAVAVGRAGRRLGPGTARSTLPHRLSPLVAGRGAAGRQGAARPGPLPCCARRGASLPGWAPSRSPSAAWDHRVDRPAWDRVLDAAGTPPVAGRAVAVVVELLAAAAGALGPGLWSVVRARAAGLCAGLFQPALDRLAWTKSVDAMGPSRPQPVVSTRSRRSRRGSTSSGRPCRQTHGQQATRAHPQPIDRWRRTGPPNRHAAQSR